MNYHKIYFFTYGSFRKSIYEYYTNLKEYFKSKDINLINLHSKDIRKEIIKKDIKNSIIIITRSIVSRHPVRLYKRKNKYFYFNPEQLSNNKSNNILKIIVNKIRYNGIISYANENINCIKNLNYFNKYKKYFIPYPTNLNIKKYTKKNIKFDVIFMGNYSTRRKKIIEQLKEKKMKVKIFHNDLWKNKKYLLYSQTKIVLDLRNIDTFKIQNVFRVYPAIYRKTLVVSEPNNENHPIDKFIIYEEYDKIVDKIVDVCNNYDYYYNKIFENFDLTEIDKYNNKYLEEFINKEVKY